MQNLVWLSSYQLTKYETKSIFFFLNKIVSASCNVTPLPYNKLTEKIDIMKVVYVNLESTEAALNPKEVSLHFLDRIYIYQ